MTISRRKLIAAAAAITPVALIPVIAGAGEAGRDGPLASPQELAARYLNWLDRERSDLGHALNFYVESSNGQHGLFVPEDYAVDAWRNKQASLFGRPQRAHDRVERMLRMIGVSLEHDEQNVFFRRDA